MTIRKHGHQNVVQRLLENINQDVLQGEVEQISDCTPEDYKRHILECSTILLGNTEERYHAVLPRVLEQGYQDVLMMVVEDKCRMYHRRLMI